MSDRVAAFAAAFLSGRPECPSDLDEATSLLGALASAGHSDAARWVGWRAAAAANQAGRHEEEGGILAALVAVLLPEPGETVKKEVAREAERAAEMALGLAGLSDESGPLALAWQNLGAAHLAAGDLDGAVRALGEGLDLAEATDLPLQAARLRLLAALTICRGGGFMPELAKRGRQAAKEIAALCPDEASDAANVAARIQPAT